MQESLISQPTLDFSDVPELFPDALLQSSEESCSGTIDGADQNSCINLNYGYHDGSSVPVYSAYYPSIEASIYSEMMEAPPPLDSIIPKELVECLQNTPPVFSMKGQNHMGPNNNQLLDGPPPQPPSPSLHQQSLIQSFYDGNDRFLAPTSPAMAATTIQATVYLTMNSGLSDLYNGGMGLPMCGVSSVESRMRKGFFQNQIMPLQFPEMKNQNMATGIYDLHSSSLQR